MIKNPSKKTYLTTLHKHFSDPRSLLKNKSPVVIYGAGRMGRIFQKKLKELNISIISFIDNNPSLKGTFIDSIPIVSLQTAKEKYKQTPILIASLLYESEIESLLSKQGFIEVYPLYILNIFYPDIFVSAEYTNYFHAVFTKPNQKLINKTYETLHERASKKIMSDLIQFRLTGNKSYIHRSHTKQPMFSVPEIFRFSDEEIFADCGAYTGDSLEAFTEQVHHYQAIYSFEPDPQNMIHLQRYIKTKGYTDIVPVPMGVFNKTGIIQFSPIGTVDARITEKNSFKPVDVTKKIAIPKNSILVTRLDDYFRDKKPPTFIKMDIEGVEKEALLGAKNIIKKYRPKLAISIYHHATDLWKLPQLIKKLNPAYSLYIRHYTDEIVDTICYAV